MKLPEEWSAPDPSARALKSTTQLIHKTCQPWTSGHLFIVNWVYSASKVHFHYLFHKQLHYRLSVKMGQRYGCFHFISGEMEIKWLVTEKNQKTPKCVDFLCIIYLYTHHTRVHTHTHTHTRRRDPMKLALSIPHLQIRKLRLRENISLASGGKYVVGKWVLNQSHFTPG